MCGTVTAKYLTCHLSDTQRALTEDPTIVRRYAREVIVEFAVKGVCHLFIRHHLSDLSVPLRTPPLLLKAHISKAHGT